MFVFQKGFFSVWVAGCWVLLSGILEKEVDGFGLCEASPFPRKVAMPESGRIQ
jgi:hypothetical protein